VPETFPAIEVDSVSFRYPGADAPALENVSLRVEPGERLGILGPNGGGKSTLMKIVLGLLTGYSGTVRVLGMSPREARDAGLVGYVPQRAEAELALPLSVREVVTLGAGWRVPPWRRTPADLRARVERVLGLVGALPFADRPIGKLSGGQMQRAMIARALAADARILMLDEPTVGIDAAGQRTFAELLARVHAETGVAVVLVSHDLRAIIAGSDRVACLARRLHSHTSPSGITPQVLAELFSHEVVGASGLLSGMHVHAHGPGEACPVDAAAPVALSIDAPRRAGGAGPSGEGGR
jgi:zinc transport system ATP-binding protein